LGHSFYHQISAWDLNSPAIDEELQKLAERRRIPLPPRRTLWQTWAKQQISCMTAVRYRGREAIAVGGEGGWITILRASDGEVLNSYKAHDEEVVAISGTSVGEHDTLISAGLEGRIVVSGLSSRKGDDESRLAIEVGDRIRAMTAIPGGRAAIGTEQGFLLFELSGTRHPDRRSY
jgi:hypothetical protein